MFIVQATVSTQHAEDISEQSSSDKTPHQKNRNAGFGGMKKGFLFSNSSKSNCTEITPAGCHQKTEDENIPFISANKDFTASQHRLDEVQQAMQVNDAFTMNKGDIVY